MNNRLKIAIIAEDTIFVEVIKKILEENIVDFSIIQLNSFSVVKQIKSKERFDIIIIDDVMSGTASNEIVNYLRFKKEIFSTIYYFSNEEYDTKRKVLAHGANFFFSKPFNPDEFIYHIKSTLKNRTT